MQLKRWGCTIATLAKSSLAILLVVLGIVACDAPSTIAGSGGLRLKDAMYCAPDANRQAPANFAVQPAVSADSAHEFGDAQSGETTSAQSVVLPPVDSGPFVECITDLDPSAPGYYIGYTDKECLNPGGSDDLDEDLLLDVCERALAAKFAPIYFVDPWECDATMWDASSPFPARLGGEYYYVAARRPNNPDGIYLAYLPAWYRDCTGAFNHAGDSEFVGVRIWFNRETMHWVASGYILSAHCLAFPPADAYCLWRYPPDYGDVLTEVPGGRPKVVVASGKHAQYAFENECTWFGDECGYSKYEIRFPVMYSRQNAGSRSRQLPWSSSNCPLATGSGPYLDATAQECIWANSTGFRGWQSAVVPGSANPYGKLLNAFFGL